MTDEFFEDFSFYLECPNKLQELYLRWNMINSKGGNILFKTISNNNQLKILDISWNNLSGDVIQIWYFKNLIILIIINIKVNSLKSTKL